LTKSQQCAIIRIKEITMTGIDKEWLLEQLKKRDMNQSDLARVLNRHRSAVSQLLAGKRRLTVEEQDRIAEVFGVSIGEISARRTPANAGFGERGQAPFKAELDERKKNGSKRASHGDDDDLPDHPIWGAMEGTIKVMPGVDLTAPMEFEWGGKLYNE
jgi:transcriptional regulator with XRE-family HTH domain